MLKKGHCLGKAHCIYSDNTVYYTVYICPDEFVAPNKEDCPPSELCNEDDSDSECSDIVISSDDESWSWSIVHFIFNSKNSYSLTSVSL